MKDKAAARKEKRESVRKRMEARHEIDSKIADISVAIIRYNRIVDSLHGELSATIKRLDACRSGFADQRELLSRAELLRRALLSAVKFLEQGTLQLHHIDRELRS